MIRPTHLLILLILLLAVAMAPARAADPLPAVLSLKADRSLLLDVARAGSRLVAVGERGHILLSDDAGGTWRQVRVPTRVMLSAVYFPTPEVGFVVGHDSTVLGTRDAGETWSLQYFREFTGLVEEPASLDEDLDDEVSDEDFYAEEQSEESRGGVARDGVPLLDVWFADASTGVAVGAYGLLLRTEDGGRTWQDRSDSMPNRDGWHLNAIAGVPGMSDAVFIGGEKGTIYRSTDRGRTFVALSSPVSGSIFGLLSTSGKTLYAFGLQGEVIRSTRLGEAWDRLDSGVTSGLNDGCVAASGAVVITGNAGVILTAAHDDSPLVGHVRADRQAVLSCAQADRGLVLVGDGGVLRSTSGGNAL